jgi:hypothetical protein
VGLIQSPGCLWIDPLIRGNYSTDTNAIAVYLFEQLATVETFFGNVSGAAAATSTAERIRKEMQRQLWPAAGEGVGGDDHFLTQRNPDNSIVDMVDYDANLLAVAYNVTTDAQAKRFMARIGKNPCARPAGYGTFVSEVSTELANCLCVATLTFVLWCVSCRD